MAGPRVDNEKLALILCQAMFFGDKAAMDEWGISHTTLINYRKRLNTNSELTQKFNHVVNDFMKGWSNNLPIAIARATQWIIDNLPELEANSENFEVVANTLKILAEVKLTKETFDVRLAEYNRQQFETTGQMASLKTITDSASSS